MVRTMIRIINKTEQKQLTTQPLTLRQVTITIATKAMDHQVTITITTKDTDATQ